MKRTLLCIALTLVGCRCEDPLEPQPARPGAVVHKTNHDKVRTPQKTPYLSASTLVIAYQGARGARPSVKRTKQEAQRLARDLAARLKQNGAVFAELARKHSDAPTAQMGGTLGAWARGGMPAIEGRLESLKIGEVSDPMETPDGYQILKRQIAVLAAAQIVVAYHGAQGVPRTLTRSKGEALRLVQELSDRLKAHPDQFFALARKNSDHRASARSGGQMGLWPRGRKPLVVEEALDQLEIGQISRPVETPSGYVLLRRNDPYPRQ